jgi:hypothetical protein
MRNLHADLWHQLFQDARFPHRRGELFFQVVEDRMTRVNHDALFPSLATQATSFLSQDQASDPTDDQIYLNVI